MEAGDFDLITQAYNHFEEEVSFDPQKVRARLIPGVCQIGVVFYFPDYLTLHSETLPNLAQSLVAHALGEYTVMGLDSVEAEPLSGEAEDSFPYEELLGRYLEMAAAIEKRLQTLDNPEARFQHCLTVMEPQITDFLAIQERTAAIEKEFFHEGIQGPGEILPSVALWMPGSEADSLLAEAAPGIEFDYGFYPSLAGEGRIYDSTGEENAPAGEALRGWLRDTFYPLIEAGGLLTKVTPRYYLDAVYPTDAKAKRLHDAGNPAAALSYLEPMIRQVGDFCQDGLPQARAGLCHFDQGNYSQAGKYFGEALDRTGEDDEALLAECYLNLGACLANTGHAAEAVSYYEKALSYDPNSALRLCNLALAYGQLGDGDNAVAQLRKAAQADRDYLRRQLDDTDLDPVRESDVFRAFLKELED